MDIKKILRVVSVVILIGIAVPASSAVIIPVAPVTGNPVNSRAAQLLQRLEEIRDMNKTELTRSDRKNIRKEVKNIKKELKPISGGVYLSVGAIIIIILLLILLL